MQNNLESTDQKEEKMRQTKAPRLIPLTKWSEHHDWPPQGGLRHLAFHAKTKGCEDVFVRCGRKVLVNEEKFFEFVERENRKVG